MKLARTKQQLTQLNDSMRVMIQHNKLAEFEVKVMEYDMKIDEATDELNARLLAINARLHGTGAPSPQPVATATTKHRMPELQLTKFAGDPLRWEEFWDDFNCSVDKRRTSRSLTSSNFWSNVSKVKQLTWRTVTTSRSTTTRSWKRLSGNDSATQKLPSQPTWKHS